MSCAVEEKASAKVAEDYRTPAGLGVTRLEVGRICRSQRSACFESKLLDVANFGVLSSLRGSQCERAS